MIPFPLRGTRYVTPDCADLVRIISEDLWTWDFDETLQFYAYFNKTKPSLEQQALLGLNDRFYLLTAICARKDAIHKFVFDRCREVESAPDGYLDLWARGHYKSTIISFAGVLQEALADPEITIGIFSFNKKLAKQFVQQIKRECEGNEVLKVIYHDVLYFNPKVDSPKWSEDEGLIFQRTSNPREATISGWGLVDAMPTGRHFRLLVYDDVIEKRNVSNPDMVKKATEAWELSDNLGVGDGTRKWHVGTRYSFADTYGVILERRILKSRLYPATNNGKLNGEPVFFSKKHWEHVKKTQRSTVAAQMLQNPVAGKEGTFSLTSFKPYELLPSALNVYIMGDPSLGISKQSDRTAIAVVGVDTGGNYYLLDGVRHRMSLQERWNYLRMLHDKWQDVPGVQLIKVGWEKYGLQADIEYFEIELRKIKEERRFVVEEINWPREGDHSKDARIARLQPLFDTGRFYVPNIVWHEEFGDCYWRVNEEWNRFDFTPAKEMTAQEREAWARGHHVRPASSSRTFSKLQQAHKTMGATWRVVDPIKRRDEDENIYDVTRALFEEMLFHPFGPKKDLVDATSRIFDMEPSAAVATHQVVPEFPDYVDA